MYKSLLFSQHWLLVRLDCNEHRALSNQWRCFLLDERVNISAEKHHKIRLFFQVQNLLILMYRVSCTGRVCFKRFSGPGRTGHPRQQNVFPAQTGLGLSGKAGSESRSP